MTKVQVWQNSQPNMNFISKLQALSTPLGPYQAQDKNIYICLSPLTFLPFGMSILLANLNQAKYKIRFIYVYILCIGFECNWKKKGKTISTICKDQVIYDQVYQKVLKNWHTLNVVPEPKIFFRDALSVEVIWSIKIAYCICLGLNNYEKRW